MRLFKPVLRLVAVGMLLATIFFTSRKLDEASSQVDNLARLDLATVCVALLLMTSAVVVFGFAWTFILLRLSNREEFAYSRLIRFFLFTWPARYVPGTVPYHASRVFIGERLGYAKVALAASVGYEAILQVSSATLLGVVALVIGYGGVVVAGGWYVVALFPFLAVPLLLQPKVLVPVSNRVLALVRRPPLPLDSVLTTADTLRAVGVLVVAHCCNGLAFWLIVNGIADGASLNAATAVGVFSLAAAAGVAVLFVPSGLGVREGVAVALLSGLVLPRSSSRGRRQQGGLRCRGPAATGSARNAPAAGPAGPQKA